MLTLDTLNVMLAVSEEGLIEEMIIALLASPQLAVFFEKFPRLKAAITDDVPRWREALRSRLKDARTHRRGDVLSAKPAPLHAAVYCAATTDPGLTASSEFPMGRTSPTVG
jgi:hypothetical protein